MPIKRFPLKLPVSLWHALRQLALERGISLQKLLLEAAERAVEGGQP